jgi:putative hemolysin
LESIPQQLILQFVLIFINAFFAMTEIAVISLSPNKLRKMMEEGDKTAPKLLKLVEEPSGFLSTIQIGITLAGFLASAFAADNFSEYLVTWVYDDLGFHVLSQKTLDVLAVIVITIILSYFTLVLGELTPKRIAMQKPLQVARISCGVVSAVAFIMRPVVWLLSASTNGLLRLLHMKTEAEEETVTEEEIRMMVDLGEARGAIESEEKEWIENVFEFGDAMVRDVMTHASDITAFSIQADDTEIENAIRETGLSRYPVYEGDIHGVQGILIAREFLLNRMQAEPKPLSQLIRPAYFVPDTLKAAALMRDMQSKKIHIAIVIDEYGDTAGLVTMEDLLEEIVGNIYDEFDPSEPAEIEQLSSDLWRVSGSADIEEVAEAVGVQLPEELDFDTLGGLVFSRLHTIPVDGAVLDVDAYGMHIHVERIEDRRIVAATVKKLPSTPTTAPEEKRD